VSARDDFDQVVTGDPSRRLGPPRAPAPRGSRLDDAWARWSADPRFSRLWRWGAPALVLLVAAVLRLWNLGHPHALVFDETYYVKDAYTLMNLGYEGAWPDEANAAFTGGDPDVYSSDASFIAHPPLGKWIIALGLAAFGAENALGWRISVAVAGILLVAATMLLARMLFRTTTLTVIAGGLLAIEGNAIVMSRVALLDTMLALFALLGAIAIVLDQRWSRRRLDDWIARREAEGRHTDWGPALLWRPWLLTAAVAFGAASAVKWSGFYFLAVFGVASIVMDALARRRAGIAFWATGSVLRQGPASFVLLVPLAAVVNVASWAGWFATAGGYYRSWVQNGNPAWGGVLEWVPLSFQNWWHYQSAMYRYHVGQSSPHSYESPAILWPFSARPTSMFYERLDDSLVQTITGIPNPLIWWAGTAAALFLVVRLVLARDGRAAVLIVGFVAGYAPWLLYPERTMFQFYSIAYEPYLVLAITLALGLLLGSPRDPRPRRTVGLAVVGVFLGLCVALSAFFLPLWTAMPISEEFLRLHYWFRSWI